jgi:hypothetical protein
MNSTSQAQRSLATGALAAAALLIALPAAAENHALIMWIGDYGNPRSDLPGIDLDAANARTIAKAMGVAPKNMTEISNANLTRANMGAALAGLQSRILDGDKVFLYYSGHGAQIPGRNTSARCTEALVARDGLFLDADLQEALTRLGRKASQVVMMNDSCFSGGAATKSLAPPSDGSRPKFLPPDAKTNTAITNDYSCGNPTNVNKLSRSLDGMAKDTRGPQVLYVAASTDTQVSLATRKGSIATLAWAACLTAANADTNGSGSINGEEMMECAQAVIDHWGAKQTVMLQGNAKLPLSFVSNASSATPAAAAPIDPPATAPAAAQAAPPAAPPAAAPAAPATVNAAQALHDLRAAADRGYQVQITLARNSLRIGKDLLDFSVSTNREGYLYLLQVGSDGKTFNLLFPNKIDTDNAVQPGTYRFPRDSWRVRAGGPAGTSHLVAIVSPVRKDLSREMDLSSVFPSSTANAASTRTLIVEATGAGGAGGGRYGASDVVSVNETP